MILRLPGRQGDPYINDYTEFFLGLRRVLPPRLIRQNWRICVRQILPRINTSAAPNRRYAAGI